MFNVTIIRADLGMKSSTENMCMESVDTVLPDPALAADLGKFLDNCRSVRSRTVQRNYPQKS